MRNQAFRLWNWGRLVCLVSLSLIVPCSLQADDSTHELQRVPSIAHFQQVSPKLYCGAQPEDEQDFVLLSQAGIKTIVCVDGTQPQVELARKYGLRYVHVPLPYSGIPQKSARMLTQVMRECDSPVFVHCHHGLHRGPAAAAVCAIAQGSFTAKEGVEFLKRSGTNPDYVGLYRDVRNFEVPALGQERVQLVEKAPVDEITDVMLRIEQHFKWLQQHAAAKHWNRESNTEHSIAIAEEFKEAARHYKKDDELKRLFLDASVQAVDLAKSQDKNQGLKLLQKLQQSCIECHANQRL